ncbi:hypothetical protein ACFQZ4_38355 [Catellatospora coxensis]
MGTRGTLENLVEMLVRVPELADPAVRDQLIEQMRLVLRRTLRVKRFDDVRHEMSSLVNTSAACSGGLRVLAAIVAEQHVGDTSAIHAAVAELSPGLLSGPDRDHLRSLLSNLAASQVAEAVDGLGGAEQLYSMRTWRDTAGAIKIMEGLPIPDDGVPQVLAFASRLSELLTGPIADGLRTWVDTVAGGLGVDLAALVLLRGGAGPLPATAAPAFTPRPRARPARAGPRRAWSAAGCRSATVTSPVAASCWTSCPRCSAAARRRPCCRRPSTASAGSARPSSSWNTSTATSTTTRWCGGSRPSAPRPCSGR